MKRAAQWLWFALALQPAAFAALDRIAVTVPVEVLAVDSGLARGEVTNRVDLMHWPVPMALQAVRVARGVVVERGSGRSEVLTLALSVPIGKTASGAADLESARQNQAWCALDSTGFANLMGNFIIPCYQDLDGDGAFETEYSGRLAGAVGVLLMRIDTPKPRSALRYRIARPEELPIFHVGYASCGRPKDKPASDPNEIRYGTYLRSPDGGRPPTVACNQVAELREVRDGEKIYRVGRFVIGVREKDGTLESRLVEGIPAGTLLANLSFNRPLMDATEKLPQVGENERPALYLVTLPQTVSAAKAGEDFLSAQVAHGITGTLRNDVKLRGWGSRLAFAAGSPVFGVPMSGTQNIGYASMETEPSMTWCVPRREEQKTLVTHCFTGPGSTAVLRSASPFLVEAISGTPRYSDPPLVDRGPVQFEGPLFLRLRYLRSKDEFLELETSVSYEREPSWQKFPARRREDGSATVLVGGAVLRLTPGAGDSGVRVEVIGGEFRLDADAAPRDVQVRRRVKPSN